MCSRHEYESNVVYGWRNNKSPAAHWFPKGADIVTYNLLWLKCCNSRNPQQIEQWRPTLCFSTRSVECIAAYGPMQPVPEICSNTDYSSSQASLAQGLSTWEFDHREIEETSITHRINFLIHRNNVQFSNGNPGSLMQTWSKTSRQRQHYCVGNVLLIRLRPIHIQISLTSLSLTLTLTLTGNCRPGASIHDNSVSGDLLNEPTG